MATEKRLIDANEIEELFYKQVEFGATDLMDAFDDALQDAQTGDNVKIIRIDSKAGHGAGKPISKVIEEQADIYAFIMYNLQCTINN